MMNSIKKITILFSILIFIQVQSAWASDLIVKYVDVDLSVPDIDSTHWTHALPVTVSLIAQPMIAPRPETTTTDKIDVQAIHNGKNMAVFLSWEDSDLSEGINLGKYSDAVALQFPLEQSDIPPAVFMGTKGNPVYIYHWRAQYQRDRDIGKPSMKELYPNINIDVYPMEYPDWGTLTEATYEQQDVFSPGKASGNPQAYTKTGVDEMIAEGFGTSSVVEGYHSVAHGEWKNGKWRVVLVRPLSVPNGPFIDPSKPSHIAFAVWQGGKKEVGSRKSVTMMWTQMVFEQEEN
jgi:hypothetical protein